MATIVVDKATLTDFLSESGTHSYEVEEFNYSKYSDTTVVGGITVNSDFVLDTDDYVTIDEYCIISDELETAEASIKELTELNNELTQYYNDLLSEHDEWGQIIENQRSLLEGVRVVPSGGAISQFFAGMGL